MSSLPFSEILKTAMDEYGVGPTKLDGLLRENGIYNITYKRISEYLRSVTTPGLEKAKALMDVLEFPMDDASLIESLEINRRIIKENREDQQQMPSSSYGRKIGVNVRLRNLNIKQDPLENYRVMIARVNELYNSNDIARYVENLIAADLKQKILEGERA